MSDHPTNPPSFSPLRRWGIAFDVVLRTALVLAVLVMANFIAAKFFHRFYLSNQTRIQLSPSTVAVVTALTNDLDVILYYDRKDNFYPDVNALLGEYQRLNPKISVHTVDYLRDAGQAELVKAKFNLGGKSDKNVIIFSLADGRSKVVPGDLLTEYKLAVSGPVDPATKQVPFERKPVAFRGEMAFTPVFLSLENPHPLKAYFVQEGPGQSPLADSGNTGFLKFAGVVGQNYVALTNLDLASQAEVPLDCNLLILAVPPTAMFDPDVQKIDRYLDEGGRLLVMFNGLGLGKPSGLEPVLEHWGVEVLADVARDAEHTITTYDLLVDQYGQHPLVAPLAEATLQLYSPRPVMKLAVNPPSADAPQVSELFFTGPNATLTGDRTAAPRRYSLACAVEQKPVVGVTTRRGTTRMVVLGDDIFLGNYYIDAAGNRDFLNAALGWLLDRSQLLEGLGPRTVTEFRLQITTRQQQQLRWVLLGGLPGSVLLLGWLVWLARRK